MSVRYTYECIGSSGSDLLSYRFDSQIVRARGEACGAKN